MAITLEKRSYDNVRCDIDCSALLNAGETITGTPALSATPTNVALAFSNILVNSAPVVYTDASTGLTRTVATGQVIQANFANGGVQAGADSTTYTVRATFTTSAGNTLEATVYLKVKDTP